MKITVVSHDLSHNCLGRAHVLANLLRHRARVQIVGYAAAGAIWAPLRDDPSVPVRVIPPTATRAEILGYLEGDAIYAVKSRQTSLGLALTARAATGVPVIADVDDWEMSFFLDNPRWMVRNALAVWAPNNMWATLRAERAVARADAVTVSSTWLQRRFGGEIVPHARDAAAYDPALDAAQLREELRIAGKKVVLFLGSGRAHKGLAAVVRALDALADPEVVFLVVGDVDGLPDRPYVRKLPQQPFRRVPRFLAASDLVVLAQQPSRTTVAQVPAKVFDAMAMAKPVIASRISDLPTILDGCGLVVDPHDPADLATAIRSVLYDRGLAQRLGRAARVRFEEKYSYEAVGPVVASIVEDVVGAVNA